MKRLSKYFRTIRSKIFFYFILFTAVVIGFLWLFQVVFLDDFYEGIKMQQITSTTNDIVANIDSEDLTDYIEDTIDSSDYCIEIYNVSESVMTYENTDNTGICGYIISDEEEIKTLYNEAIANGGTVTKESNATLAYESFQDWSYNKQFNLYNSTNPGLNDTFGQNNSTLNTPSTTTIETISSVSVGQVAYSDGEVYFVIVNSRITMVDEIAETIQYQLLIIVAVLVFLSLIMALTISSRLSKPLASINEAAKGLAKGTYDFQFKGKTYIEVEELNETLHYASEEIDKSEKLKNELIANMSHDLRTPLTMITGYAEVMRDIPNENTPENVQIIIDECNRLTALVNDILDLSKLQSGTQSLQLKTFNLTQTVEDIVNRFQQFLNQDGFTITFTYENEVNVEADPVKINQVVYNLMVNATHYAGKDKQVIVKQIEKENTVRIEVIDHGEGISEEDLESVWDRYYKIDKVHKRATMGSGLGLSIVKGILDLHHATYGVKSKVGEGSTFYFELKKQ